MGRPIKKGIDYFLVPTGEDHFSDTILAEFGPEGYLMFHRLLKRIYGVDGWYMPYEQSKIRIYLYGMGYSTDRKTMNRFKAIIETLLEIGFFDPLKLKEFSILTSYDIQSYFFLTVATKRFRPDRTGNIQVQPIKFIYPKIYQELIENFSPTEKIPVRNFDEVESSELTEKSREFGATQTPVWGNPNPSLGQPKVHGGREGASERAQRDFFSDENPSVSNQSESKVEPDNMAEKKVKRVKKAPHPATSEMRTAWENAHNMPFVHSLENNQSMAGIVNFLDAWVRKNNPDEHAPEVINKMMVEVWTYILQRKQELTYFNEIVSIPLLCKKLPDLIQTINVKSHEPASKVNGSGKINYGKFAS